MIDWENIERCQDAGVNAFELNFSYLNSHHERKMSAVIGQDPAIIKEVCGRVIKFGYGMAKDLSEGLLEFMEGKGFETIDDSKGLSLSYFTTLAELVRSGTAMIS